MKLNRLFSAILSVALLIGLCSCNPDEPVNVNPFATARASARPSPTSGGLETPPEGSDSPDPSAPPASGFDRNHRLNVAIPDLIDGLEMPVVGATGYASVTLPLYSSIPGGTVNPNPPPSQSPSPSPSEPEPSQNVPPDATDSPEPSPDGTGEPAPDETGEPVPDDPIETAPEDPESEPAETPAPVSLAARTLTPLSAGTSNVVATLNPGTAFLILEERGEWWRVSRGDMTGWIEHRYCMINLPDVIPSMIYDDVNAYSSIFVSCGKNIPGVTGEVFYHTLVYNIRLNRQEFVMPILYSAARHICAAQHKALAEGNCLVVYQTFRPYDTQIAVANAMYQFANVDPEVRAGISTPPWSLDWFIATGVANHQQGYALDASIVKVNAAEIRYVGSYPYLYMTEYEDYNMPTVMHELSMAAVSTISPSSTQLSESMNEPAIALRGYFTSSGLSPLASEWWHFNDFSAQQAASAHPSDGKYYMSECLSRMP